MHWEWPLMWKSRHRQVQLENFTLRSALKEANDELRKHRALIGGLRTGQEEVTRQMERILATPTLKR